MPKVCRHKVVTELRDLYLLFGFLGDLASSFFRVSSPSLSVSSSELCFFGCFFFFVRFLCLAPFFSPSSAV